MSLIDRRTFLKGCCVAGLGGAGAVRAFGHFDHPRAKLGADEVLIVLFLRGGIDGLHLLPPVAGPDRIPYEMARPNLRIPVAGAGAALPLPGTNWGLHPNASLLRDLYLSGKLAVAVATGLTETVTRSHFDAQAFMELGRVEGDVGSGWIARHLATAPYAMPAVVTPAFALSETLPTSLYGTDRAIAFNDGDDFRVNGFHWSWDYSETGSGFGGQHVGAVDRIAQFWTGTSPLEVAGATANEALSLFRAIDFDLYSVNDTSGYQPANGAVYPNNRLGTQFRNLAQLLKLDLGLRVATIDFGGWDTHESQGRTVDFAGGYFGDRVQDLSEALHAFCLDLDGGLLPKVSVIVHSEFGRRLKENDDRGTDHGYGNVMLALGGTVNGGTVFGDFQGLDASQGQLYQNEDIKVTTDYRQILAEALIRRLRNPALGQVFPTLGSYQPLGIFQGTDIEPDFDDGTDILLRDGFES